jgi:hypothetical protein
MRRTLVGERLSPTYRIHTCQRDAHACSWHSFVDHGIPGLSSGSAHTEDVVKGVTTLSTCACVHTPPQQRLRRVW